MLLTLQIKEFFKDWWIQVPRLGDGESEREWVASQNGDIVGTVELKTKNFHRRSIFHLSQTGLRSYALDLVIGDPKEFEGSRLYIYDQNRGILSNPISDFIPSEESGGVFNFQIDRTEGNLVIRMKNGCYLGPELLDPDD